MTDYTCPVGGCDFETNSTASIRAHIYAKGDDAHEWDELKADIESQETADESADAPDPTPDPDDSDDGDSADVSDRDVDAEYQQQYQDTDADDGDDSDDPDDGDDAPASSSAGWALVAASVGIILAVLLRGDSDDDVPADSPSGDDDLGELDGWTGGDL
jgi:hypothetical protein